MGAGLVTGRPWFADDGDGATTSVSKLLLVHGPPSSRCGVSSVIYCMSEMVEARNPKDVERLVKVMEQRAIMEPMGGVPTVGPNREIVNYEDERWMFFELGRAAPDSRWCTVQNYVMGIDALIWVFGTPDLVRTPTAWEPQGEPVDEKFPPGHPYHKHKETKKERKVREALELKRADEIAARRKKRLLYELTEEYRALEAEKAAKAVEAKLARAAAARKANPLAALELASAEAAATVLAVGLNAPKTSRASTAVCGALTTFWDVDVCGLKNAEESHLRAGAAARSARPRAVVCQGVEHKAAWLSASRPLGCGEVKLCRPYSTDVASGQFCAECIKHAHDLDKKPDHRRLLWLLERADDLCQKGADRYFAGEQAALQKRRRLARLDFETTGLEYTEAELDAAAEKKREVTYIGAKAALRPSTAKADLEVADAAAAGVGGSAVPETATASAATPGVSSAASENAIAAMVSAATDSQALGLPLLVFYNKYAGDTSTAAEREKLLGLKYIVGRRIRIQEVCLANGGVLKLRRLLYPSPFRANPSHNLTRSP